MLNRKGNFIRFEDRRIDNKHAQEFLVKKSVGRTSAPKANYLYDNSAYVFGYSDKEDDSTKYFKEFKSKVEAIHKVFPKYEVRLEVSEKGCDLLYTKDVTVVDEKRNKFLLIS